MNKILITGGAGYIGSHAVLESLKHGFKVVVVDNLFRGYQEVINVLQNKFGKDKLFFYKVDLMDRSALEGVFVKEKPEAVMHFGALCLVNESMEKPGLYFKNNVLGTLNLLEVMLENGCKYLVFSSTCATYGESAYLPVDELHPQSPTNPYGESKLMAEKEIIWFSKLKNLNYVIFRYFNVAGAETNGLIGDSKKPSQLLIQNAVRGALGIEEFKLTCPTVDTKDGTPIRDYINVEDLADVHLVALDYLTRGGRSDIFNLGTGMGNSVLEIINQVKQVTGVNFEVSQAEARKGEYAHLYADISRVSKVLGWKPKRSIKESVQSLVKWYQNKPNGWSY